MPESTIFVIGWIAGALTFFGYVPYFVSTIRGKTKPNRVTWWVLVVVGSMLVGSYYSLGAEETIWVPIGYVIGPLIIAILSVWFGEGGWSKFDLICLGGAITAGLVWWLLNEPLFALIINLTMDWLGLMPTVRKSYHRPHTEQRLAWMCWFIGTFINLFAIDKWTIEIAFYPLYMAIGNGIITFLVFYRRKFYNPLDYV